MFPPAAIDPAPEILRTIPLHLQSVRRVGRESSDNTSRGTHSGVASATEYCRKWTPGRSKFRRCATRVIQVSSEYWSDVLRLRVRPVGQYRTSLRRLTAVRKQGYTPICIKRSWLEELFALLDRCGACACSDIAAVRAAERDRQCAGLIRGGDQMHVIGHQTIGQHAQAGLLSIGAKRLQIDLGDRRR